MFYFVSELNNKLRFLILFGTPSAESTNPKGLWRETSFTDFLHLLRNLLRQTIGTRPALSMSVPVRCYSVDTMNNNIDQQQHVAINARMDDDESMMLSKVQVSEEMQHNQRMLLEGRLGTPDAADAVLMESHGEQASNYHLLAGATASNGCHLAGGGPQDLAGAKSLSQQKQPLLSSPQHQQPPQPNMSFDQMLDKVRELIALEPKFLPSLFLYPETDVSTEHFLLLFCTALPFHFQLSYQTAIIFCLLLHALLCYFFFIAIA